MKTSVQLLLTLLSFSFSENLCSQDCQLIYPIIDSSDPISQSGYIDICPGDVVTFSGLGEYPENNTNYTQSDASSTLSWAIGADAEYEGTAISHTFQDPGFYIVAFQITDIMDCVSDSIATQIVRVSGGLDVNFIPENPGATCTVDSLIVYPQTIQPVSYNPGFLSTDLTALPDGTGAAYEDEIFVSGFSSSETLASGDLIGVCVKIEHSWMRDLEIKLRCPDSTTIILHDHPAPIGGPVFLGEPFEDDEGQTPIPGVGYTYCWTVDATNGTWIEYANTNNPATLPAGNYNSFESFDNLNGCPLNGNWQISVQDLWGVDNGNIFSWELIFEEGAYPTGLEPFSVFPTVAGWQADPAIVYTDLDTAYIQSTNSELLQLEVVDNFGCTSVFPYEFTPLEFDNPACLDCSELTIDLGPDVQYLPCDLLVLELDASNSTVNQYMQVAWTTPDGSFLSNPNNITVLVDQPGMYTFTYMSPFTGCQLSKTIEVVLDNSSTIADAGNDITVNCGTNGLVLNGTGSSQGAGYIYAWTVFSGPGTIVSGASTLNPVILGSGIYQLEVISTNTICSAIDQVEVIFEDELLLEIQIMDASCNEMDGAITLIPDPAAGALTYEWSTGDTGPSVSNLAAGNYVVNVSNIDCTIEYQLEVGEDISCKLIIQGHVFDDSIDPDCLPNSNPIGLAGILIHLLPTDIYTYTDDSGFYEFIVDPGDYAVTYIPENLFELMCPVAGNIDISESEPAISMDNDFYSKSIAGFDLYPMAYPGVLRPDMEHNILVYVENVGQSSVSPIFVFEHDPLLESLNLELIANSYDPNTGIATFNLDELGAEETVQLAIDLFLPASVPLGTVVNNSYSAVPINGDLSPLNNTFVYPQTVTNSYDPNNKRTLTGESEFGGMIFESDTTLSYQIRFQNIGTDTAFAVEIRDTLSPFLNVETIRAGVSSHDYSLEFEGNNILIFRFEDILLPDSTTNFDESQGFVSFQINRHTDLEIGTEIYNTAAITFDSNEPIITNETLHLLSMPTSIESLSSGQTNIWVEPNPTDGQFEIKFKLTDPDVLSLRIYDQTGKRIEVPKHLGIQDDGVHEILLDSTNWGSGIYFIQIQGERVSMLTKLVVK